ncbi:MAG: cob(I)yrinic acid a,c-diamide adenosyltransferase [Muribaculaceae bacterium]|nr:cob(I)yrinic acid a,c-diamide adenosyltransferase [Muribaculaceae bacterium]
MKQIYTKTGDEGMTSLRDGVRVPKDDSRIEANGQIDQLNALLGVVRSMLGDDEAHALLVHAVQRELMTIMSHIATPDGSVNPRELHAAEITTKLEQAIDRIDYQGGFVVPGGGSQLAAFIHLARTQARMVERRLWSLNREHPVDSSVLVMVNRLSDYLFVLANEKE